MLSMTRERSFESDVRFGRFIPVLVAASAHSEPSRQAKVQDDDMPLHKYPSGTAGPKAADELIAPRKWRGL